jgi:Tfp pilus assembly protein PilO
VTDRLAALPARAQVALVAAALLLVAMLGYFVLIAPKRSTASDLKKQAAAVQAQIDSNRSSGFKQALPAVRSASVFSLAKAMPTQLETPNVILQLDVLALESGISFDQIQPGTSDTSTLSATGTTEPFAAQPIQVEFSGSFYNLLTFLQRLRNLVRVQKGTLFTAGRLFDVSGVTFQEGPQGWPQIQATLTINEFVPQPTAPATPAPGATDTTSTTTTPATTTTTTPTTTSTPTSAAPSTSGGTS